MPAMSIARGSVRLFVYGMAFASLAGCETMGVAGQSKQVQGSVLGGLLGAGTGSVIGNQTGHAGAGTAIGAGLGALGGAMMGNALNEQDRGAQHAHLPAAYGTTKFCPVGGELYGDQVIYCPVHGVELRERQ
jgi:hypothetical protein